MVQMKWISLVLYWEFTATTIHIYTNACICAGLCKRLWHLIISSNENTDQLIVWTKAMDRYDLRFSRAVEVAFIIVQNQLWDVIVSCFMTYMLVVATYSVLKL